MSEVFGIIGSFLAHVSIIDVVILFVLGLYAIEGYANGFVASVFDIISFFLAFVAGLKFYMPIGGFLMNFFHFPQTIANPIGFALGAILVELVFRIVQNKLLILFQKNSLFNQSPIFEINRILGIIPGIISGGVLLAFLLTVLTILPLSEGIKQAIGNSIIGTQLVASTQGLERALATSVGKKSTDLLTFLTIEPQENSSISLGFKVPNGIVDTKSEEKMLQMVNEQRAQQGLAVLVMDNLLQKVAQEHAQDMFSRGYFSHYTPEGKSPFERMNDAGVIYTAAGENLAFSPTVDLAMQGLLKSPGHRANILSPNFRRVGIGIIDGGIYGEMFAQEFSD